VVALFIVSGEEAVGKTAIAAGIGKRLTSEGRKVGYLKPAPKDGDVAFMKQVLNLAEPVEALTPALDGIKQALARVSGRDVVIIEGRCGQSPEDNLSKAAYQIAENVSAKVLVVEGYTPELGRMELVETYKGFGGNLIGVVCNKVPKSQLEKVERQVSPRFNEAGIPVLGEIPEDRALLAITIGELAGAIQGEILNNADRSNELVENIMLGAMYVDSGLEYFGRKANKAVILRHDRPDMQLAALETPTKCLVISGNSTSVHVSVRASAERKKIPIILAKGDVNTIISNIEEALAKSRFSQEGKLKKLAEILEAEVDFKALYKALGLTS